MPDLRPPTSDPLPPDVVLRVRHVSKKFCRHLRRSMWYGIQDLGRNLIGRPAGLVLDGKRGLDRFAENSQEDAVAKSSCPLFPADNNATIQTDGQRSIGLRPHEFWALQDINVDVRRGEVLGLIGMNGCGKTTLLRLIAGIFPPDLGEIAIRGRTGALIALGAGFHPHMTGRENVYLNAAILGLSRQEIRDRFQAIIDFAEIGPFIDAPVSTYSSGMRVKLGFAIAINVQADLLLIDEVLAVGDMGFKIKCLNAIRGLMADTAVVFVSHSMQFISQFCTRVMVMNAGQMICDTESVPTAIDQYLQQFPVTKSMVGTGQATIENLRLSTPHAAWSGDVEGTCKEGEALTVDFDVQLSTKAIPTIKVSLLILNQGHDALVTYHDNNIYREENHPYSDRYHVTIPLGSLQLTTGKYCLVLIVVDPTTKSVLARLQGVGPFRVVSERVEWTSFSRKTTMRICPSR